MEETDIEEVIVQAKHIHAALLSLSAVTTSEASQQCTRVSYSHPFTTLPVSVLRSVFHYLDWMDCTQTSQVCYAFREIITSRQFQVLVFRSNKLNIGTTEIASEPTQVAEPASIDYSSWSKEKILAETKKTLAVNAYLHEKFASQKRRNERLDVQVSKGKDELRIQVQLRNKTAARVKQLEEKGVYVKAVSLEAALERDAANIEQKTAVLDGELKRCEGKYKELTGHKKLLVTEVKRLRKKLEEDKTTAKEYLRTVERVQRYFEEMHAPRIEAMAPDIDWH